MTSCGLLKPSREPVPLRSISVDVVIQGFVADVVSELRYQNEEKNPVEAIFVFPLDDDAAVYAFEGLIGGTRIEAQIGEKKQAEQEYDDAVSEGHQAFLLGREENTSDIFTCSLGNLPPDGEATLKLRYVQALAPEPDGAVRFVLPAVLNPRYVPRDSQGDTVTESISRVPKGQLPYTLSLHATVESSFGINRVESKCTLQPLCYTAEDRTAAQVSLAEGHQFDRDVELLIYYEDVHKPSAILEAGKPGVAPGSLMGDPALLLTMYPSFPAEKPAQSSTGEFIFLLDRSGSMDCHTDNTPDSPSRIQSAKETLIFLLKSLPLGCYFNIYGFGSRYDSFYPKSVEYTQETMSDSLQRVKELEADLGGTEILQPLKAIYSEPCHEGHPRQLFVFTDGEVSNTDKVIAEVQHHSSSHRCFSFGIGEGASTALIKGIARAAGGSAEFITGKERMQAKALQSLKKALQPAVTKISLNWHLPSSLEAMLVGSGPRVIFQGQRCLIYAQICGQLQPTDSMTGKAVLHYTFQDQTFTETATFSLHAQEKDRLPIHRLAAQVLLQHLEGNEDEGKKRLALETSLSSGVVCSQTAYIGVNTDLGKPLQGSLTRRNIPLAYGGSGFMCAMYSVPQPMMCSMPALGARNEYSPGALGFGVAKAAPRYLKISRRKQHTIGCYSSSSPPEVAMSAAPQSFDEEKPSPKEEESPLLHLVSLQNANGSWPLASNLASILGLSEAEILSKIPAQVAQNVWATVLALLWLHSKALEQKDEWELLEMKALNWLHATAAPCLAEIVKAGNALLGTSVDPQTLGV
uniref:von Willebrand factor A domain-containing protein 5A-like n=1 Tax=Pogona vitticeps TaxID=103695 RepID=A0A6J0UQQ6_9SAUR